MLKFFILPVLAAGLAFAQPPAGQGARGTHARGHSFESIKSYLGLSDAQVSSMVEARRSSAEANRTLAKDLRTKHEALQQALNNGSTDATAIGQATLEIQSLRKQLQANVAKGREQAVSFLSAEQKAKLAALKESRDLRREIREAHALQLIAPAAGKGHAFGAHRGMHHRGEKGPRKPEKE